MHILRTKSFIKAYEKLSQKLQKKVEVRLILFLNDPNEPILRYHALKGARNGVYSINVTGDYRILLRFGKKGEIEFIALIDIGTHSQLY